MKKIFSILALVLVAMSASAIVKQYDLTVGTTAHGSLAFTSTGGTALNKAEETETVNVTISPATGWSTKGVTARAYLTFADAKARGQRRDGVQTAILNVMTVSLQSLGNNVWQFTMPAAHVEVSATYAKMLTHDDITVDVQDDETYDGKAHTPKVVVKDGTKTLVENTDYTLQYENNVDAGVASITIYAKSADYSSSRVETFRIQQAAMTVTAPEAKNLTYSGEAQPLAKEGKTEGGTVEYQLNGGAWSTDMPVGTEAGDYTVGYRYHADTNHFPPDEGELTVTIAPAALTAATLAETNFTFDGSEHEAQVTAVTAGTLTVPESDYEVSGTTATETGSYEVTVTGKNNFTGTVKAPFTVLKADAKSFDISIGSTEFVYDGSEQKPTVEVKYNGEVLVEGTDYVLTYENDTEAGTATVTATGIGNYSGTQTKTYTIAKADISLETEVTAPTAVEGLVYNGQPQTLIAEGTAKGGEMVYSAGGTTYGTTLPAMTNAGEYTVYYKVNGDKNHNDVDAQKLTVTIAPAELTQVTLVNDALTYNGEEQTVQVANVMAGELAVDGDSYDVSGNSATDAGEYTVSVTGKGNFSGTVTATYTIAKRDYSVTSAMPIMDLKYNGRKQTLVTPATASDGGVVVYSFDGEQWSEQVPDATDAATYTVYSKVLGDDNHNESPVQAVDVTIAQGEGSLSLVKTAVSVSYGTQGYVMKPVVQLGDGQLRYATSDASVADVNYLTGELYLNAVGTATITITMAGTQNATSDAVSYELTVTPYEAASLMTVSTIPADGVPTIIVQRQATALVEGKDYTLSFEDAQGQAVSKDQMVAAPGSYVAVVNLMGNYSGSLRHDITVSGATTGISSVSGAAMENGTWYDLQGRRLAGKPAKKGTYILNGKKVVVK